MKKEIKQDIKIAVCGILTLLLLVLTVFELIPEKKSGIIVKDTVTVASSPLDASMSSYENIVSGTLFNETDKTITIDALTVRVSDGESEKDIPIDLSKSPAFSSYALEPRTKLEFSATEFSGYDFADVKEVRLTVQGELYMLSNVNKSAVSIVAILLIALLLVFGFMLYRTILVRYYMYKEPKKEELPAQEEQ